jgi:pimeloyl-ACP methyl ester carboxylesterase
MRFHHVLTGGTGVILDRKETNPMKSRRLFVLVLVLSCLVAAQSGPNAFSQPQSVAQTQPPSPPPVQPAKGNAPAGADLIWAFKIPMRDGIRLNGTVFRPTGQKEPLPVIFTLTPYISDSYQNRASYFSQHGYVFVLVDVRGRGNSEGDFDPFSQEPNDGHDIVEFLAQQPWCNGKVTMWGGSYAGFDQWATLKELPPHLATVVPVASAHAGVDFPFFKGIWTSYDMQWLTFTSGKTGNANLFGESSFWIQKFREMYLGQRPFNTLDQLSATRPRSSRNGYNIPPTTVTGKGWLPRPSSTPR